MGTGVVKLRRMASHEGGAPLVQAVYEASIVAVAKLIVRLLPCIEEQRWRPVDLDLDYVPCSSRLV